MVRSFRKSYFVNSLSIYTLSPLQGLYFLLPYRGLHPLLYTDSLSGLTLKFLNVKRWVASLNPHEKPEFPGQECSQTDTSAGSTQGLGTSWGSTVMFTLNS